MKRELLYHFIEYFYLLHSSVLRNINITYFRQKNKLYLLNIHLFDLSKKAIREMH